MNRSIKGLKALYNKAKEAKVGTECFCPSCGTKFVKTNYQQAFCKTKVGTTCKDHYWNNVTPTKKNNQTRISPASSAYMVSQIEERGTVRKRYTTEGYEIIHGVAYDKFGDPVYDVDPFDNDHPFSSDGLGQR